ncbi:hypothetical protein SDC9_23386 [bioreactor metagenome]|uniref:Uncharacterized protein n=1 Tax=bioreactor metagenome TaxID=1076179 RepID=A0A644UF86_9ZZZZ|nr:hypothetical protein [Lentimicrobium sp.]MEA5111041.1 hypothetical protein [Lentimicrobium sp.]
MKNLNTSRQPRAERAYGLSGAAWLLGLMLLLLTAGLQAQTLRQLDRQIATMLASPNTAIVNEGQHLQSLVADLYPTLYIIKGELSYNGGNYPVRVECDAASITSLYQPLPSYSGVEIIIIKMNSPAELGARVDLTRLTAFSQLKYIYFLCTFDVCPEFNQSRTCVEDRLSPMLSGPGDGVMMMLYKVSVPS